MSSVVGGGLRGRIERALAGPASPPLAEGDPRGAGAEPAAAGGVPDLLFEGTDRVQTREPVAVRGPIDPRVSGVYVLWSQRSPAVGRARVGPSAAADPLARADGSAKLQASATSSAESHATGATWRAPAPELASPPAAGGASDGPSTIQGLTLRGRMARHVGAASIDEPAPTSVAGVGAGFAHEVSRWPRIRPAPPLLVGRPLELPGSEGWCSAAEWLFRQVDPDMLERAVFLDVEATGLGHGAGTVAFVVGLAAFDGDAWRVEQWVLSRLSAETAMLAALHARLTAAAGLLVTFNGASFDLPLLRGRLRRCGLGAEVLAGPHLDLLPVARRLWRGRGPDCRLATLERLQLGVRREGDIAGRAIPEVFWAALRDPEDRRARAGIRQVCGHNLVDVLTMPALALAMARTLAAPADVEQAVRAADHLNAIGRRTQAEAVLERWAAAGGDADARPGGERGPEARDGGGRAGPSRVQRTVRAARLAADSGS